MNILVLSWRDTKHPQAGGAEQVMHEHAKSWVSAGFNVVFFSSHFKGAPRNEILDGICISRYGYQMLGVQIAAFFWYLWGRMARFDLVVDQFHGIPFFTPLYVKGKKLAVVQEVAKEVWLMNSLPVPLNWIVGRIGYFLEPLIFSLYKNVQFLTASESTRKDLMSFGIKRANIIIIEHGINVGSLATSSVKEKKKTITFLGALTKDKGIEDALLSFSILSDLNDSFQFWVIGKGGKPFVEYLLSESKRLGLEGKIKFWGFISDKKKFDLLARSHVLINPSVREGWGLVNIEASFVGTPVVAYPSPGLVDSVKNGVSGVICKESTPRDMADNVARLLGDKKEYRRMQNGAKRWSKRFSWNKSRTKSINLIRRLLQGTKRTL